MKKVAIIIPGFGCNGRPEYKKIASFFKEKGIKPLPLNINWKRTSVSDWFPEALNFYEQNCKGEEVYMLGFSFGAMIALLLAQQVKVKKLFVCSLSPYFKEDLPFLKEWWKKSLGKKKIRDFSNLSFSKIKIPSTTTVYLIKGSLEGAEIDRRFDQAKKKFKPKKSVSIESVNHDISDKKYLETIKNLLIS